MMIDPDLILGNSNRRFSGVTSTMLATLPGVAAEMKTAILGSHHLPEGIATLTFRELLRLGKDGRPRVFHARRNDEMIQALLARRLGVNLKVLFTSTAQRHHTRFTKWLISRMDGLLTTCTAAASYLEKPADVMIPHGVDLQKYRPPVDKTAAWSTTGFPGKFGLGIFGRVRPQKGVDLLIDAAIPVLQANPDPTLVIVGETTPKYRDYETDLRRKVTAAGLAERVIFHGKRPADELPGLFQAMTLVAALSRNEGFGLTVLEAMASGCAVLASEAGAWKDIVEDGVHGALVPCDDLPRTRKALEKLLSPESDLAAMGQTSRAHVEAKYAIEHEVEALCRYYKTHLEG